MVKFPSLSDRLVALAPPERPSEPVARPQEQRDRPRDAAAEATAAENTPEDRPISSAAEVDRARQDVRAALARFGREAPARGSTSEERPQPPGQILDLRV